MSIFDDWQLLKPSLWSVQDLVDEIVIVDGAYEWMASAAGTLKRGPERSREEVYDILSSFGKKVKVVNGVWRNETHKRQAGYEACQGRYVLRNDADEIFFWDEQRFEAFLKSECSVGQMEMPLYPYPDKIRAKAVSSAIERQSFLFDTKKIDARQHLSYLWLVLPDDERGKLHPADHRQVFGEPLAFTAHLTHWRPPESAVNRARFYVMNYIRGTGALGWVRNFNYTPEGGFGAFFKIVPPEIFNGILMGDAIVAGPANLTGWTIRPSGRPILWDRVFALQYDNMLDGLTRLNDEFCLRPRAIANGVRYNIDASRNSSLSMLDSDGRLNLSFDTDLQGATASLTRHLDDGSLVSTDLPCKIEARKVSFVVPRLDADDPTTWRRTVGLTARFARDIVYATFMAS